MKFQFWLAINVILILGFTGEVECSEIITKEAMDKILNDEAQDDYDELPVHLTY